jgi:hypothetical protein
MNPLLCKCGYKKYRYSKICRKCFIETNDFTSRLGRWAKKGSVPINIKEKPSYRAVHIWVQKRLGNPSECSNCKLTDKNTRKFHWANISRKYLRNVKDYVRLCAKCHKKYDIDYKFNLKK